jgi:hypothetical protein
MFFSLSRTWVPVYPAYRFIKLPSAWTATVYLERCVWPGRYYVLWDREPRTRNFYHEGAGDGGAQEEHKAELRLAGTQRIYTNTRYYVLYIWYSRINAIYLILSIPDYILGILSYRVYSGTTYYKRDTRDQEFNHEGAQRNTKANYDSPEYEGSILILDTLGLILYI